MFNSRLLQCLYQLSVSLYSAGAGAPSCVDQNLSAEHISTTRVTANLCILFVKMIMYLFTRTSAWNVPTGHWTDFD